MVAPNVIIKNLAGLGGKHSRANDYSRPPLFSADCSNMVSQIGETISLVNGHKLIAQGYGGAGVTTYQRSDLTTAQTIEELVGIDNNLRRLKQGTLTITYVPGTAVNRTFSIVPVDPPGTSGEYVATVKEEGVSIGSQAFTAAVGTASTYYISALATWVGTLAGGGGGTYTAVASGGTPAAIPAAALALINDATIGTGGVGDPALIIPYYYWEQVPCPTSNPFATYWATRLLSSFELASMQNCDDQLFIATGVNELYVYDSLGVYRAGMPRTTSFAAAVGAATGLTGTYEYMITYEFLNAVNKTVEGDESNRSTVTLANRKADLTFPYIQAAAGFYTHNATISSAAGSPATTVPVTAGHDIVAGDRIVVTDPTTQQGQERLVLIAASTLLTLDASTAYTNTAPMNIASTVRVNVWRNAAGDTELKYLRAQFGNNDGTATGTYTDSLADATLIGYATYDPPAKPHSLPPANLRYLTVYQAGLVASKGNDDQVWFSDWDGPHYWPDGESSFNLLSKQAGIVTGLRANRELVAITKAGIVHSAIGDFPNTQFRQELIADAIGCDSYHTMLDVGGSLWYWSKNAGYSKTVSSGVPQDLTYRILPDFSASDRNLTARINARRATAVNLKRLQHVFLFLPAESLAPTNEPYPNDNSLLYVGDYREQEKIGEDGFPMIKWWPCTGINMAGGATVYGDRLYFMERRYNTTTAAMEYNLCVLLEEKTAYDYHFHALPIPYRYSTTWYHGDMPSVLKKWVRCRLYAMGQGITSGFSTLVQLAKEFLSGNIASERTIEISLSGFGSGWGVGGWGVESWGDPDTVEAVFEFIPTVAKAVQVTISGDAFCEQVRFTGLEIQAVPQYEESIS